ncbi:MAG: ATP-binding protein [Arthrospira sp. SH-MAG29]|nr:ATP-binding protein [Arthrospira sp. SH-MAG29]MBS0015258.1 ATP-binding protein [Arthrospira sp. SH-MAG29]
MTDSNRPFTHDQQTLILALTRIKERIKAASLGETRPETTVANIVPPVLEQLCDTFGLSTFEQDLLLLCAGMELDADFPLLCAEANGDPQKPYPTFSLALNIFDDPHWSALTPNAPLRRWRLLEVGGGAVLTLSPLRIDERILHYLIGIQHLDERLFGIVESLGEPSLLVPSHQQLALKIAQTWSNFSEESQLPVVQICGEDIATRQAIAQVVCQQLDLELYLMDGDRIPSATAEFNLMLKLWERESVLGGYALVIDCEQVEMSRHRDGIWQLIERIGSPLMITVRDRLPQRTRPLLNFEVTRPGAAEQYQYWEEHLGEGTTHLNGHLQRVTAQFNLPSPAILAVCTATASQGISPEDTETFIDHLWDACRLQARPRMEDMAQRIEVKATWADLVLPSAQMQVLETMAAHLRQRSQVYENWGFGKKSDRGLGISALFAGPSGTGKTTAAEVLAQALRLDLYKIDLSSVISKYIGETEKNLRRVFDAAESGGAILLFDEADALFGKRSEVKDSHDRHANIEVSYLLQRMEAYRGLAILTTNMKGALDPAFLRRIRFVVQFPFPDAKQRAEIWRRIFPSETPTDGLTVEKLARLSVSGGNIRNIALNAAFLAADAGEAVMMKHLLAAAQSEYMKLEKPLMDSEVKGWV